MKRTMYDKDYWKIEYELDGEQKVAYAMGSYKIYNKQKTPLLG